VNVSKVWLTVSSVLLGLSFIFGNSIRNIFESVVFLFVVHPFDVGDALLVTDPSNAKDGAQYSKVRVLNVLFSTPKKFWWCTPWTSATRCSLRTPVTPMTAPSTARYALKQILGVYFLDAGDALLVTDPSQRQGRHPVQLGNVNFSKHVLNSHNSFLQFPCTPATAHSTARFAPRQSILRVLVDEPKSVAPLTHGGDHAVPHISNTKLFGS